MQATAQETTDYEALYQQIELDGPSAWLLNPQAGEEGRFFAAQILLKRSSKDHLGALDFVLSNYSAVDEAHASVSRKVAAIVTSILGLEFQSLLGSTSSSSSMVPTPTVYLAVLGLIGGSFDAILVDRNTQEPEKEMLNRARFSLRLLDDLNTSTLSTQPPDTPIFANAIIQGLRDGIRDTAQGHTMIASLIKVMSLFKEPSWLCNADRMDIMLMAFRQFAFFTGWIPLASLNSLRALEIIASALRASAEGSCGDYSSSILAETIRIITSLLAKGMPPDEKAQVLESSLPLLESLLPDPNLYHEPNEGDCIPPRCTREVVNTIVSAFSELFNQTVRLLSATPIKDYWQFLVRALTAFLHLLRLASRSRGSTMRTWTLCRDMVSDIDEFWTTAAALIRKFVAFYAGCPAEIPSDVVLETRGGHSENVHHRKYKSLAFLPAETVRSYYPKSAVLYPQCHPMTENITDDLRETLEVDIADLRPILSSIFDGLFGEWMVHLVTLGPDEETTLLDTIRNTIALDPEGTAVQFVRSLWLESLASEATVSPAAIYAILALTKQLLDHYKDLPKLLRLYAVRSTDSGQGLVNCWEDITASASRCPMPLMCNDMMWTRSMICLYDEVIWKLINAMVPAIWRSDQPETSALVRPFVEVLCSPLGMRYRSTDETLNSRDTIPKLSSSMILRLCKSHPQALLTSGSLQILVGLIDDTQSLPPVEGSRVFEALARLIFVRPSDPRSTIDDHAREALIKSAFCGTSTDRNVKNSLAEVDGLEVVRAMRFKVACVKYLDEHNELKEILIDEVNKGLDAILNASSFSLERISGAVFVLSARPTIYDIEARMYKMNQLIHLVLEGDPTNPDVIQSVISVIRLLPLPLDSAAHPSEARQAMLAYLTPREGRPQGVLDHVLSRVLNFAETVPSELSKPLLESLFLTSTRLLGSPLHCPPEHGAAVKAVLAEYNTIPSAIEKLLHLKNESLFGMESTESHWPDDLRLVQLQCLREVVAIPLQIYSSRYEIIASQSLSRASTMLQTNSALSSDSVTAKILREYVTIGQEILKQQSSTIVERTIDSVIGRPGWASTPEGAVRIQAFLSAPIMTGLLGAVSEWSTIIAFSCKK